MFIENAMSSQKALTWLTHGNAYVLEEYKNGRLEKGIILPFVGGINISRPTAVDFEWTLGEHPVLDHTGLRNATITITGRSGIERRLGQARNGGPLFATGDKLFRELELFLDDFQENAAAETTAFSVSWEKKRKLAFRALFEEKVFWVKVDSFSWSRNVSTSRFGYEWTLNLTAYRNADMPDLYDVFLHGMGDVGAVADRYINAVSGYIAIVGEGMKRIDSSLSALLKGPMRSIAGFLSAIEGSIGATGSLTKIPVGALFLAINLCDQALLSARRIGNSFQYGQLDPKSYYEAASAIQELRRALQFGSKIAQKDLHSQNAGFFPSSEAGYTMYDEQQSGLEVAYTVQEGEDLPAIAEKTTGDSENAAEIAALNGMADIWTMPDGSPLGAGDVILIPAPKGAIFQYAIANPDDVYGVDLLLDKDGDLVINGTTGTDYVMVRGRLLLEQALTVRLQTQQGQHGVWSDYGMPGIIGDPALLTTAGTLLSQSRQQLLNDPRIESISNLTVMDEGDTFGLECTLEAIGGQSVNTIVPLGG